MRRSKRYGCLAAMLLMAFLLLGGCAMEEDMDASAWAPLPTTVWADLTITVGDTQLHGVLYENETAKRFAAQLPLNVQLWNPAPGFAKAFDLPVEIPDLEQHTRYYELGGLAYWPPGPSVAIFHSDHLEQTIVSVIPIGRITDDVSIFADYEGSVTFLLTDEPCRDN